MDAVQKANSGHPGAPMGAADIAEVLWRDVLKFNPGNPTEAYGRHVQPNVDGRRGIVCRAGGYGQAVADLRQDDDRLGTPGQGSRQKPCVPQAKGVTCAPRRRRA